MKRQTKRWMASRELVDDTDLGTRVIVHLGAPERVSDEEWKCSFVIEGIEKSAITESHGIDAFQAILTALDAIALRIRRSGRNLSWPGAVTGGDSGFPRQILLSLGAELSTRVEKFMDAEVQRFVDESKQRLSRG